MSELARLIAELRAAGVTLRVAGDELVVRAPKGAVTAPMAAALKENKGELLAFLQDAQASRERQATRVSPVAADMRDRLSDAQQRLWFLYQLEGPSPTYNMPLVVRIAGDLDADRLEQALRRVASRHETLRTRFVEEDGRPRAVIDPESQLTLQRLNWEENGQDQELQIESACEAATNLSFDLSAEHLIRATLIRLRDGSYLLLVTLHHLIADGWSLANFIAELTHGYNKPGEILPSLEVQYADYVCWAHSQRGFADSELNWWREYLADAPEQLSLPADFPRPATASYAGSELCVPLEPALVSSVENLARQTNSTPYMVCLAAFALTLHRLAGSLGTEDIVVGTTVANRDLPELEPLIGLFINMLPLRLAPSSCQSVGELIESVKAHYLAAYAHRGTAFERIVEALNPPRVLNRAPIFQVVFDMQNQPDVEVTLEGCEFTPVRPAVSKAKFDLSVALHMSSGQGEIHCIWNSDILEHGTVLCWMQNYLEVLRNFAAGPSRRLEETGSTPAGILDAWREQQKACTRPLPGTCWLEEFDAQALAAPDRPAVVFAGQSLTYAALRARARAIASALLRRGVKPEDRVVVLLDRQLDLLAALLGVQYAGAAYVPVDPGYPEERLRWVLEDAAPAVILTEEAHQSLAPLAPFNTLTVESIGECAIDEALPGPRVESLAYIIFTSGSTGRPKGVEIEHRSLRNFLRSMAREPGMSADDVMLAVTTVSFDIAVLELYLPLMVGARVVIADRMTAVDGRALRAMLGEQGITCLQATPSTWRLLLDAGWRDAGGLKALCGGEALPTALADDICAAGAALWNMYGPTETTVWSSVRRVMPAVRSSPSGNVPVGAGIDNTFLYVLDERGEPVGPGAVGELWIGGLGLARGYWQRPDLTAERYRPDPFSPVPGARMYGTGDLVRPRAGGEIDFLGRIDNQVKLRGFRIELGEIESALRNLPGVSAAVAMAVGDDPASRQLVAFAQTSDTDADLKAPLHRLLPAYMVPATVSALESLPLTPNGKVDRRALASRVRKDSTRLAAPTPPGGKLEQVIASVWAAELNIENPDIETNIFELGAHSLMLARVQRELEKALDRSVDLIELFKNPTIRSLGRYLESHRPAVARGPERRSGTEGHEDVAVIGIAGRFPGAATMEAFWELLLSGATAIQRFTAEQLRDAGLEEALIASPDFVAAHGAINDIDMFDAEFFGVRPSEARLIDPQHRLFLQTAVHALENAGYASFDQAQNIGVYAGCGQNDYLVNHVLPYLQDNPDEDAFNAMLASEKDFLTTRVSYLLNLTGPSLDIQTACSTGLVAVHVACRALRGGECDMALAGAVALRVPQINGQLYQKGAIVSPDGNCRPFDEAAAGTVWGSGVGALVLKPLSRALDDGDPIVAVIKGTAINNDGAEKVGFTAPGVSGQSAVIRAALRDARVDPSDVGMIETHGTATPLGDMIEISALKAIWETDAQPCYLGSVKAQIGHLNSAAGIAGLIKALLAVKHARIPLLSGFQKPGAHLRLEGSPLVCPTQTLEWPRRGAPVAGVSSFGIGGTNAHVVVAGAPASQAENSAPPRPQIIALSANTAPALAQLRRQAGDHWAHGGGDINRLSWTLACGAVARGHRLALVADDVKEAGGILIDSNRQLISGVAPGASPGVAFLYSGQGTQSVGMAAEVYRRFPAFQAALDEAAALIAQRSAIDLVDLVCREHDAARREELGKTLNQTRVAQPVLFAVQYALTRLWRSWGVVPDRLMGHSLGELSAACAAGVFDLHTGIDLVCRRAELCWEQPGGAMLAVAAPVEALRALIGDEVDIAAVNGPRSTVCSGPADAIAGIALQLERNGVDARQLEISHAFHSRLMVNAQTAFESSLQTAALHPPQIPLVSTFSGHWLSDQEATSPAYWARQLTATVQFRRSLECLAADDALLFLEIGPRQVLTELARSIIDHPPRAIAGSLTERGCLSAAASLWCSNVPVRLAETCGDEAGIRRRVSLPPTPFRRERHWIDKGQQERQPARLPLDDWFFIPGWRPAPWLRGSGASRCWQIEGHLPDFLRSLGDALTLRTGWDLPALAGAETGSTGVLLLALPGQGENACPRLMRLLSQWAQTYPGKALQVRVLARDLFPVLPGDRPDAELAALRGIVLVLAQEYPSIDIRCIDSDAFDALSIAAIAAELSAQEGPQFVAFRGGQRYLPDPVPVRLPRSETVPACLRQGGNYLIFGGSGRVGLTIAGYLIKRCSARVILVSRGQPSLLTDSVAAATEWICADIADAQQVDRLFEQLAARGIQIHGVFHAAGDPSHSVPVEKCPDSWPWPVIVPKLYGVENIARHVNHTADFCVLISSLSSLFGGLGYLEYAAANAALDAMAWRFANTTRTAWLTINWDAWRFNDDQPASWISADEGMDALDRILANMPLRQVMVTTQPPEFRLRHLGGRATEEVEAAEHVPQQDGLTPTQATISAVWRQLLGRPHIALDDDYFALGGDSLLAIRVVESLRVKLNRPVHLSALVENSTVRGLAAAIDYSVNEDLSILVPMGRGTREQRIVLLPGTGGSITYLAPLARHLGECGYSTVGLQALGLDAREAPKASIEDIAADNLSALQLGPDDSVILIGHSLGSWVGLEMARQLSAQNLPPPPLIVLDTARPAPRNNNAMQQWTDAEWMVSIADSVTQAWGVELAVDAAVLHGLSWDDLITWLHRQLIERDVLPAKSDTRLVSGIADVFRAQAMISYAPPTREVTDITLIRAEQPLEDYSDGVPDSIAADPAWGWRDFSSADVAVHAAPGNHLSMVSPVNVAALTAIIDRALGSAGDNP